MNDPAGTRALVTGGASVSGTALQADGGIQGPRLRPAAER